MATSSNVTTVFSHLVVHLMTRNLNVRQSQGRSSFYRLTRGSVTSSLPPNPPYALLLDSCPHGQNLTLYRATASRVSNCISTSNLCLHVSPKTRFPYWSDGPSFVDKAQFQMYPKLTRSPNNPFCPGFQNPAMCPWLCGSDKIAFRGFIKFFTALSFPMRVSAKISPRGVANTS